MLKGFPIVAAESYSSCVLSESFSKLEHYFFAKQSIIIRFIETIIRIYNNSFDMNLKLLKSFGGLLEVSEFYFLFLKKRIKIHANFTSFFLVKPWNFFMM